MQDHIGRKASGDGFSGYTSQREKTVKVANMLAGVGGQAGMGMSNTSAAGGTTPPRSRDVSLGYRSLLAHFPLASAHVLGPGGSITTGQQFEREWRQAKKDPAAEWAVLASVAPASLPKIFRLNLATELMVEIVHAAGAAEGQSEAVRGCAFCST